MKTVNALIVDDEPLARDIIQTHVNKVPNWKVIQTCINAEEAYEALLEHDIDVLFLDIQMPVITGVEFLQSIRNPPLVIFTTAYSDFALKGFELNVVDYLLKPISYSRFFESVEKANAMLETKNKELESDKSKPPYFFVKHDGKLLKIVFSEIIYIKAEQEYSHIFTRDGKLLVSMHLKLLEEVLPVCIFTRIHRSYIIPHETITSIYGNAIQIGDGIELPIGNKYREKLMLKLKIK